MNRQLFRVYNPARYHAFLNQWADRPTQEIEVILTETIDLIMMLATGRLIDRAIALQDLLINREDTC